MRRAMLILLLGLAGGAAAYWSVYRMGTATPRTLLETPIPELAWLQLEFNLSDAEFRRITELHAGYLPQCMDRCDAIEALNQKLSAALEETTQMTPELQRLLSERAQIRAQCQAEMLRHFIEVSHAMAPEQGRRYLAWVWENTSLREQPMDHSASDAAAIAPHSEPP